MRGKDDEMDFEERIKAMEAEVEKAQEAYDLITRLSREAIQKCGKAVVLMHNGDYKQAEELVGEADKKVNETRKLDKRFAYLSIQAKQELSEAKIFLEIKRHKKIPAKDEIGMEETEPYILGLMDVVGELKREAQASLIAKDTKSAMEYLGFMKEIYDATAGMRFSDAVLPDFRKKQDVARILIENTGSDLLKFV